MDILSSLSGVPGIPKAAMVEMEQRTEALLKSSSFQGMLELEKKYKVERLRAAQSLLPSSQHAAQLKGATPPRPERPDSGFPQEHFLMVNATRRTTCPPPLSISVPQAVDSERRGRPSEREDERAIEEDTDIATPTNSEPFQKQVKFLATDDDHDEEDGMSEQSSICQSPSWEGYGQRKKEKKKEAEQRRREKEQAEKDVRAAKKRNTARLSKAPPAPATATRNSRLVGLMAADRSMSDSLLVSRHLLQHTQPIQRPEEVGRTVSADDIQNSRLHRPAVTQVLSGSSDNSRRAGGPAGGKPSPSAIPHHLLCDSDLASTHDLRRATPDGPEPLNHHASSTLPPRHGNRSPRDAAFPPSASRTPRLRHISPSAGNRSNGMLQGTTSANHSQESLSAGPTADRPRGNGYVVHQRAQAAEWAMAGLADEQLVGNVGQYYPPSKSSSGQTQPTRRSSLTQDARSVAMKLVGMKTPSSGRESASQANYLTFKAIAYSDCGVDASASVASMPTLPRKVDGEDPSTSEAAIMGSDSELHEAEAALQRPTTSQSSLSSSGPSLTGSAPGSRSKMARSLKDAAKAALAMSKGSQIPTDTSTPTISMPPFLALRARLHSRTSVHTENKASRAAEAARDPELVCVLLHSAFLASIKPQEIDAQEPYRASEGSSSSSAFEDGSPLPSPTTTPDTSRPQSAKDIPLATSDLTKVNAQPDGLQDDEQTLRQSLDSSKSSTPRVGDSVARESIQAGAEDRWSRTALPIDMDCDAQSFMTTVSHFDNVDTEQLSSNSPSLPPAGSGQPKALKPVSRSSSRSGDAEPALSIPPRSRERNQATPVGSPTVSSSSGDERHGGVVTEHTTLDVSVDLGETPSIKESSMFRASTSYARPFQQGEEKESGLRVSEGHKERHREKSTKTARHDNMLGVREQEEEETIGIAAQNVSQREQMPGSISGPSSVGSMSPDAPSSEFQVSNNPFFANFPETFKHHGILREIPTPTGPPSPVSLPSPLHPVPPQSAAQPRANSAPSPSLASTATSRTSTPSARSPGTPPVSILKQPKTSTSEHRPQILSALPKHMQLQTGSPARPPTTLAETRMAPIAKMLVECCSCKFYHDMPSKIYECMAKPDAVIEDKLLGISGAITTMVKCPWCQHNMSRNCCAGYAAVVYLKEKLH
ncbi:hypothetical protein N657DRAFT_564271 [Parathielavia appendiculata]|uniref:Uncharacterized protein n=1 Tax=Parathielavia appendiculata TaxID=2587402 RepID=A0AAN6UC80_9PEZI|nr:hypothetical protein N657DRAFT_564271 [Parathielavia appendiculata]